MRLSQTLVLAATLCSLAAGCGSTPGLGFAQDIGQAPSLETMEVPTTDLPEFGVQGLGAVYRKPAGTEIAYGSDREQRLDIYGLRNGGARRPVMVYVHGGGWQVGDKRYGMQDKPRFFNAMGHVFISVNYRLARTSLPVDKRPMHPCQIRDVAAAIGWVSRNVANYGGDPGKIMLMGHSAGAHLVTLAASHGGYLAEQGLGLSAIRGVVANDSASYDLTAPEPDVRGMVANAFGTDPAVLEDATPMLQLREGRGTAPMLVLVQGRRNRVQHARKFHLATLKTDPAAPGDAFQEIRAYGYDHGGMNEAVGKTGERVVTPLVRAFCRRMLGQ